jgi:hypothetical protein
MILFCIPPPSRLQDFGDNFLTLGVKILLLDLLGYVLSDVKLGGGMREDRGAVF